MSVGFGSKYKKYPIPPMWVFWIKLAKRACFAATGASIIQNSPILAFTFMIMGAVADEASNYIGEEINENKPDTDKENG